MIIGHKCPACERDDMLGVVVRGTCKRDAEAEIVVQDCDCELTDDQRECVFQTVMEAA